MIDDLSQSAAAKSPSPALSPETFRSRPSKAERGTAIGTGCGTMFTAFGSLLLSVFGPIGATIGLALCVILMCKAVWESVAGVPDLVRTGACPHCDAKVTIRNRESAAISCPACKHRLVLRDTLTLDVTG